MDAFRRWITLCAVLPAVLLAACASDGRFVDHDGWTNYAALEAAESDCSNFWNVFTAVVVSALLGAAEVAAISQSSGNAGDGALLGAGTGAGLALLIGGASSQDDYRRCMAAKGYVQVTASGT